VSEHKKGATTETRCGPKRTPRATQRRLPRHPRRKAQQPHSPAGVLRPWLRRRRRAAATPASPLSASETRGRAAKGCPPRGPPACARRARRRAPPRRRRRRSASRLRRQAALDWQRMRSPETPRRERARRGRDAAQRRSGARAAAWFGRAAAALSTRFSLAATWLPSGQRTLISREEQHGVCGI
jgi:hypothetical protein